MNIPQIEYVEEPHALLIEKHMEIQVVRQNFEEIFWTLFSNKDWENFGIYYFTSQFIF
jgi:hypothetical protein